jgi:hypothetical protein
MTYYFWLGREAHAAATEQATREQLERERLPVVEVAQEYE